MHPWYYELFHPSLWEWGDAGYLVHRHCHGRLVLARLQYPPLDQKKEERARAAKIAIFSQSFSETEENDLESAYSGLESF